MRRLLPALLVLATACGGSPLSPEEKAMRCKEFAGAVAVARLSSTPSEQVARDVANALDNTLSRMGTPALHTPAVEVHRDLHAVEVARRAGDDAKADAAAARARAALAELATACSLPLAAFLGAQR